MNVFGGSILHFIYCVADVGLRVHDKQLEVLNLIMVLLIHIHHVLL